jgi:hypothetical protein
MLQVSAWNDGRICAAKTPAACPYNELVLVDEACDLPTILEDGRFWEVFEYIAASTADYTSKV